MNKLITALGACAALSTLPTGASAHGGYYYYPGDAALGGFVGGVVGGLIGSGGVPVYAAPAPVVVQPAPVVVEPYYAPAPVYVAPYAGGVVYGARPGYYYSHGRYYPYHHRHHHHDDD